MMDDPVFAARAIEALAQAQALAIARLGLMLSAAGVPGEKIAADLREMADSIEAIETPVPIVTRAVAVPLRDYAGAFERAAGTRVFIIADND